jgi:hypothetical protein
VFVANPQLMQTVIATDRETRERPIPDEPALPMPETEPPRPVTGITTDGADDGVVSPELVLVDPALRQLLAARPLPTPTIAPPVAAPNPDPVVLPEPAAVTQTDAASLPLRVAEPRSAAPAPAPPLVPSVLPKRRRWWPIVLAALAGGALAAAATIVLLPRGTAKPEVERVVDPSTGQIGQPAASTPTAPSTTTAAAATTAPAPPRSTTGQAPKSANPPATHPVTTAGTTPSTPTTTHHRQPSKPKTSTTPKAPTKSNPAAPAATAQQKLAWAPTAGATAYDMELLRGTRPVFHTRTSHSSVEIVVRKGADGPAGSLPAGEYEWIVWPIVHGHRAAQPIVRSRLTLPS